MNYSKFLLLIITSFATIGTGYSQINTERYRQDSDSGFTGSVDIDALAQTGNTDFQFLGVGGRLNYNRSESYTFFVFSGGYGWNDGKQFSNELITHLRNVERINSHIQFEAFIQFDYNKKRKLLARELIGAGLRYKIITTETFKLRTGSAYFFEAEEYDLDPDAVHDRRTNTHRLSTYVTSEIEIKKDLRFLSVSYFQPDLKSFSDYRLISENTLSIVLSSLINLNIKFNVRYDATPPDGIKNLDTITKLGLSLKF